jgi:hypothetical protein
MCAADRSWIDLTAAVSFSRRATIIRVAGRSHARGRTHTAPIARRCAWISLTASPVIVGATPSLRMNVSTSSALPATVPLGGTAALTTRGPGYGPDTTTIGPWWSQWSRCGWWR